MTTLIQIRKFDLLQGESMSLRNITDVQNMFTINGIKTFYLVLIHDLQDAEIELPNISSLFKSRYRNLANADFENILYKFLYSNIEYDLYFNNSESKIIPRSSGHTFNYEGDLLVYIPIYEIILGWD